MDKYIAAKVGIHGTKATVLESNSITVGLTGAVVQLIYDDDLWQGMRKKVTFRGPCKIDVLTDENEVQLPWEVTTAKNVPVCVGVTGVDAAEKVLIPTVWATIGTVLDSAAGHNPAPGEPVPPVWAQVFSIIGELEKLDTENRENLVAAINEVLSKVGTGGGNVDLSVYVKSVNGVAPDKDGNVKITIPDSSQNALLTVETITIGEADDIPVTGITLDYNSISLNAGDSMMLAASVSPSNATNNKVLWVSDNTEVATVNNGYVTAVSAGNAVITAYSDENNAIKATCSVDVAAESGGAVTVLYRNLDIVQGSLAKIDGTIASISNGMYVEFPYYEGMVVSTLSNGNWHMNYPPIAVYTNGAYKSVDYTEDSVDGNTAKHYTATLTGYPTGSVVRVNIFTGTLAIEAADEYLYYSYES